MMWFKKMLYNWVEDGAREKDAEEGIMNIDMAFDPSTIGGGKKGKVIGQTIDQQLPNIRVNVLNAINGKVIQVFTPISRSTPSAPHMVGYDSDFKSELYLLTEDELLSDAITKLILLKSEKFEGET